MRGCLNVSFRRQTQEWAPLCGFIASVVPCANMQGQCCGRGLKLQIFIFGEKVERCYWSVHWCLELHTCMYGFPESQTGENKIWQGFLGPCGWGMESSVQLCEIKYKLFGSRVSQRGDAAFACLGLQLCIKNDYILLVVRLIFVKNISVIKFMWFYLSIIYQYAFYKIMY